MAIIIKGDGDDTVKQRGNSDDTIILGFGSDSAFGAKGSDVIVGEVLDFEIVDDVVFDSDKTLDGEGGNDIIYGDAANVFVDLFSEGSFVDTLVSKTIIFGSEPNPISGGGIIGGSGDDILYGDLQNLSISVVVGEPFIEFQIFLSAVYRDNILTFGNDTLNGNTGNDVIYGDLETFSISVKVGHAPEELNLEAKLQESNFIFGNDVLNGEAGIDILYGDLHTLAIIAEGGNAEIIDSENSTSAHAFVRRNIFEFGNDTLNGGSNNDTLYGDLHTLNLTAVGGTLDGGPAGAAALIGQHVGAGNLFTLGDDVLDGGGGKDTLYGDLHTMSLNAMGGTAVAAAGNSSNTNAGMVENSFVLGSDTLLGKGGADTLYGDAHTVSLTAIGGLGDGSRANGNAVIGFLQTYTFGNDTLEGGRGDDILYGDLHTFSIVQIEGTIINGGEAIAKVILNDFIFGDDLINGGNDADELHGDLVVFSLAESIISVEVTADNHIEITDASVFSTSPFPNTITWGNDQLTGGKGDDTFVFTLIEDINGNMIMQGNDVILDFKFNDDILEFRDVIDADQSGVVDINDLVAVTDLSFVDVDNDGVGDVNIQFVDVATGMDEMGSIVLKDVADPLSAQPSILDLIDVITVVEA